MLISTPCQLRLGSRWKHSYTHARSPLETPQNSLRSSQLGQLILIYQKDGANPLPSIADDSATYIACLVANLVNAKNFDVPEWDTLAPYLSFLTQTPEPVKIARDCIVGSASEDAGDDEVLKDEDEGEDLCNYQFSLALWCQDPAQHCCSQPEAWPPLQPVRQERYWKADPYAAITNGQVKGFPSPNEVHTFYVKHQWL